MKHVISVLLALALMAMGCQALAEGGFAVTLETLDPQTLNIDAQALEAIAGGEIAAVSPDGGTFLVAGKDLAVIARPEGMKLIAVNPRRGAGDEDGTLARMLNKSYGLRVLTGEGGAAFSPDGRYAALTSIHLIDIMRSLGLILVDLETGELFRAVAYGDKPRDDDFGLVTGACFSADSGSVYYTVYGHSNRLCRYDIATGEVQTLYEELYQNFLPQMARLPDGSLLMIGQYAGARTKGLLTYAPPGGGLPVAMLTDDAGGSWSAHLTDFPVVWWYPNLMLWSEACGCALLSGQHGLVYGMDLHLLLQRVEPAADMAGMDTFYAIDLQTRLPMALDVEAAEAIVREGRVQERLAVIAGVCLSPEGEYAAVLSSIKDDIALTVVRLSDMSAVVAENIDAMMLDTSLLHQDPRLYWTRTGGEELLILSSPFGTRAAALRMN